MEKVLVINSGSSSLKFQLFDDKTADVLASGLIERIGLKGSAVTLKVNGEKIKVEKEIQNHKEAISSLFKALEENKIIENINEIVKVGHRVVQGGEYFTESALVEDLELNKIKELASLAPLHNIPNALGIEVIRDILPKAKNIAVFDTEFHQTMPSESYLYATPYSWYEEHKVRRYGAHGTSHKYVTHEIAKIRNKNVEDEKYIICHLGNGASITAVKGGKSIQTSMGLTPLDGIMMGTRSGAIDPAIVQYMCNQLNVSVDEITRILNFESGLLGLGGASSDLRDIHVELQKGNKRVKEAFNVYITRIVEVIGSYYFRLGGADVIAFTAGVGENDYDVREAVIKQLEFLGVTLNKEANDKNSQRVSGEDSKVEVLVVPTDEEYQIFKETKKF